MRYGLLSTCAVLLWCAVAYAQSTRDVVAHVDARAEVAAALYAASATQAAAARVADANLRAQRIEIERLWKHRLMGSIFISHCSRDKADAVAMRDCSRPKAGERCTYRRPNASPRDTNGSASGCNALGSTQSGTGVVERYAAWREERKQEGRQ